MGTAFGCPFRWHRLFRWSRARSDAPDSFSTQVQKTARFTFHSG
ncbi:hypothetical protein EPIB2_1008 [Tritonibacter mobilis]|nr:hypothetical protein EPIB2_1008 [Tritonibacter mobilis]